MNSPLASPPASAHCLPSALRGRVRAPGDKSISHRALILGALACGTTHVRGLLEGADILSTAGAMRALGADITRGQDGVWTVVGTGPRGLSQPQGDVDCGNAGTGVRLIMGAAAGYPIAVRYIGDASLSSRPMGRVADPLRQMGVDISGEPGDRLPMTLTGSAALTPISYTPPIASAQVKSCLLLAGLRANGTTQIHETHLTRDHSENMLRAFGARVEQIKKGEGQTVRITGPAELKGCDVTVPGDPSSAAFLIAAALIVPGSDIVIENVMMNPTRTGLFETLIEMGAFIRADNFRTSGGEVVADLHVKHGPLVGVSVPEPRAASMIDEYPILAVIASFARGVTHMPGIGELRVKESDRIAATAAIIQKAGGTVIAGDDFMSVTGNGGAVYPGGAQITTFHDHRIAMSTLVMGLRCAAALTVDDASMIATSFPDFFDLMGAIGAQVTP